MAENKDIRLRNINCPACGGALQLPIGRNKATCIYCGNEVVVDEGAWLGKLDEYELKLKNAECALDNKEWTMAEERFEDCKRINETDPRCWMGLIRARTRDLTAGFDRSTESYFHCYINRAGNDVDKDFVQRYREYLHKAADNDASKAASRAKDNITYFQNVIESEKERIADQEQKIKDIHNRPTEEMAESRYGKAKNKLIVNMVMLVLAPLFTAGFVILALYLVVDSVRNELHLAGILGSLVAAVVFAIVTKLAWKFRRRTLDSFKRNRVSKLREDDINEERAKDGKRQEAMRIDDIANCRETISGLERDIVRQNEYLEIDRDKRIAYFEKLHLDAAGLYNDITPDAKILEFCDMEKGQMYPGYRFLTKIK